MPVVKNVVVLVGSLRKASYALQMAKELIACTTPDLLLEIAEIGQLPLYNEDLDSEKVPAQWTLFRERLHKAEALLFVTPEYNRSVPGALKNALDVASRPYGKNMFDGKPGAVLSISTGAAGGFGANHHLRQSLTFLNVPLMQQPEAYLGRVDTLFDDNGRLQENTREFLVKFMQAYAHWVSTILNQQ